jgi:hypoxanthine phosphoribosyltransferase
LSDPDLGEVLVTAEDLQRRVLELGEQISSDYREQSSSLLLVGVLKGAVFFLSDLMRHIDIPVEVDFMAVASYGSATDSSGVVRILKDLDAAIEGRDVLIVEDIVDSGLTLQYLLRNLGSRNPRSARGVRAADQARAAQGRSTHPLRRLRDRRPLRRSATGSTTPSATATCHTSRRWSARSGPAHRCSACEWGTGGGVVSWPQNPTLHGTLGPGDQPQTVPEHSGTSHEPFLQERRSSQSSSSWCWRSSP